VDFALIGDEGKLIGFDAVAGVFDSGDPDTWILASIFPISIVNQELMLGESFVVRQKEGDSLETWIFLIGLSEPGASALLTS
jgi:hypothetical protein